MLREIFYSSIYWPFRWNLIILSAEAKWRETVSTLACWGNFDAVERESEQCFQTVVLNRFALPWILKMRVQFSGARAVAKLQQNANAFSQSRSTHMQWKSKKENKTRPRTDQRQRGKQTTFLWWQRLTNVRLMKTFCVLYFFNQSAGGNKSSMGRWLQTDKPWNWDSERIGDIIIFIPWGTLTRATQ